MATTEKTSLALAKEELHWAQARAKRTKRSLSSVVTDALYMARQSEARLAVLRHVEGKRRVTEAEIAAVILEWG